MNKMIKMVMALAMFVVVSLQANDSNFFNKIDKETLGGGFVGSNALFIYDQRGDKTKLDVNNMKVVLAVAQKSVCSSEDMRKVIDAGIAIEYVYLKNDGVGVVNINSCK